MFFYSTFNGDNKQIEVKDASNNPVGKYFYDGNGKRVKKVTSTETVIFIYDGMGKLAAEYSTATPTSNPTTNYTATDPLGSPRVITNKQGQIVSRRDFMPFGEEVAPDATYRKAALKYGANDNIRQKFTGYQRDEETGLDFAEARYYNNSHGRFTAVDPLLASGKSANPQTFNRYAYTMNRPLILTDSTGLQAGQKYDGNTSPTLKAIAFAIGNWNTAHRIGTGSERQSLSSAAINFSGTRHSGLSDSDTHEGSQVNAVRHTVWQATITREFGADIATKAGNVHEREPTVDLSVRNFTGDANNLGNADQTIDLLNNQIGRQIASDNPTATNNELAQRTIEYFRDVGLFTATINANGSVTANQTRISGEQANVAIASIRRLNNFGQTEAEQREDAAAVVAAENQRKENQRRLPAKHQE